MNIQGNSQLTTFNNGINTNEINDLNNTVKIILDDNTIDLIADNILINGGPLQPGGGIVTNPLNTDLNIGTIYDIVDNSGLSLRGIDLRTENIGTGLNTQYFMGDGSFLQYSANSGNSNFYLYKSHINTPGAPPANGFVYYNNNTQGMATIIYISHLTDDNIDIEIFFNNINQINDVYLQDRNDSTNYIKYNITGPPTIVVGSYIEIPVQLIVASGTGAISFGVNHNILLSFFTNNIEVDSRLSTLENQTQYQLSSAGNTFFSGILTSNFIKVLGGVSTEFLKANGTLDSNTYATTAITDNLLPKKIFLKNITAGIILGVPYVNICSSTIGNMIIPANSVKQGDIYQIYIEGAYVMTSGAAKPLIRITIGGTIFTAVDIFAPSSGSFGFKFISKFSFFTIGAVATGSAITTLETGSLSGAVANSQMAFIPGGLGTFNTTISNTILIEAHSTSPTITVNLVPYFIYMSII
jgi:hypothetical protein